MCEWKKLEVVLLAPVLMPCVPHLETLPQLCYQPVVLFADISNQILDLYEAVDKYSKLKQEIRRCLSPYERIQIHARTFVLAESPHLSYFCTGRFRATGSPAVPAKVESRGSTSVSPPLPTSAPPVPASAPPLPAKAPPSADREDGPDAKRAKYE